MRVAAVTKPFGGLTALDGLAVSVPRGPASAVIGPNGAGKSTALMVIAAAIPGPPHTRVSSHGARFEIEGQAEDDSLVRMNRSGGAPTRAERAYSELRADILTGRRRPGSRLPFAELSAQYDVSMGVAREALTRLTAEGLVESQPQHGFQVMPVSIPDLQHLTEARCAIETLVLREAVAHGGLRWESETLAAHHRLEGTPQMAPEDPDRVTEEWAAAHNAYHLALLSGCPNPRLRAVAASLRDSAELYRRWSVPLDREGRDIVGEHRSMLDAVLAHDADKAAAVLAEHIQHTGDVLLNQPGDADAVDSRRDPTQAR